MWREVSNKYPLRAKQVAKNFIHCSFNNKEAIITVLICWESLDVEPVCALSTPLHVLQSNVS